MRRVHGAADRDGGGSGHDHVVAGVQECGRLVLPAAAVIRHAVDEHGDLVAFALVAHVVVVTTMFMVFPGKLMVLVSFLFRLVLFFGHSSGR